MVFCSAERLICLARPPGQLTVKTQTKWPGPRAQTAQPVRWRMRRWSKEPRRIWVVAGRAAASLVRAAGMATCFTLTNETHGGYSCQGPPGGGEALNFLHHDETTTNRA